MPERSGVRRPARSASSRLLAARSSRYVAKERYWVETFRNAEKILHGVSLRIALIQSAWKIVEVDLGGRNIGDNAE
jgi:hypothetical protein